MDYLESPEGAGHKRRLGADQDVHRHGNERYGDVRRRALTDARRPPAESPDARPPPVGLRVREVLGRQVAVEDRRPQRPQVGGRADEEQEYDHQRREVEDRRHRDLRFYAALRPRRV